VVVEEAELIRLQEHLLKMAAKVILQELIRQQEIQVISLAVEEAENIQLQV
jgi:hypothetical protein